jgi:GMP synthase-like glutamine amidotransferase
MRVHYLQHVAFEGLGSIESWLERRSARLACTRLHAGEPLPRAGDFDWLIAMGGPMSVNDEARLPWLRAEKELIGNAIAAGRHVLGICLGAQLIAAALGARVYRNAQPEIGWFPIEPIAGTAPPNPFDDVFSAAGEVFHWHGETFDLPAGATLLARSEGCPRQAFALGHRVLGLQFHLETTPAGAQALVANCRGEMVPGPYVQSPDEILRTAERFDRIHRLMERVLETLAAAP